MKDLARLKDPIEFERPIPMPYGVNYPAKEITTKYSMRNCCYAMLTWNAKYKENDLKGRDKTSFEDER